MPVARSERPAINRYSRTPATKIAATMATTGVVTVASGALDPYQDGDLCTLVNTDDGTAITGGTGGTTPLKFGGRRYAIQKLTATTCALYDGSMAGTKVSNVGVAVTAGMSLQFGDPDTTVQLSANIVPAGSVKGGGYGGPLD